jgi:hypothetical protein
MPNSPHQPPNSIFKLENYTLAVIEFDDQGRCYDRRQMTDLATELKRLGTGDAIIIVFVHGWQHDGRSDDDNLMSFRKVLEQIAKDEGKKGVPVFGVFVAWRGLSLYGFNFLEYLTFWDRKQAGLRVSMGAPRELFGRLREFRRDRLYKGGAPLLVIIGHSFGGMIVFGALAQSLIEAAASTQAGEIVPSFADLVMLVNPAFEAVRYLPLHDLVKQRDLNGFASNQNPVFVSVTAINDWATGLAFPLGMATTRVFEATRGAEEKQALIYTMGHLSWMRTHALSVLPPINSDATARRIGGCWLQHMQFSESNPFWVASATPDVINGHNGIWLPSFVDFAQSVLIGHVRNARARRKR